MKTARSLVSTVLYSLILPEISYATKSSHFMQQPQIKLIDQSFIVPESSRCEIENYEILTLWFWKYPSVTLKISFHFTKFILIYNISCAVLYYDCEKILVSGKHRISFTLTNILEPLHQKLPESFTWYFFSFYGLLEIRYWFKDKYL